VDECWSKVSSDYGEQLERGSHSTKTGGRACTSQPAGTRGIEPDPRVLDWHISYETRRADLKVIEASG
jgi:hypothetical protein